MSVVVMSSAIRTARNGKNYLDLEVFDGVDTINGKIWDWTHANNIEKNAILDLQGTMSEYLGAKQLGITSYKRNLELPLASFAPTSVFDPAEYLQKAFDLIDLIEPISLRELTKTVYNDYTTEFLAVPGAKKVHHAFLAGTLVHSVDTAKKALAIARVTTGAHAGLCIAGALLHDLGKLKTYTVDGIVVEMTEDGEAFDHIPLGIQMLSWYLDATNHNLIWLLNHIIASHHGKLEYGSPVTPHFLEAYIVNFADGIDAKSETIRALDSKSTGDYTDKEWSLDNRRMLTRKRVHELIGG
jgi:3'-5' exoribonuclease